MPTNPSTFWMRMFTMADFSRPMAIRDAIARFSSMVFFRISVGSCQILPNITAARLRLSFRIRPSSIRPCSLWSM